MRSLREEIERGVQRALVEVVGPEGAGIDPLVRPTQEPRFGDYQSNVALGLAKKLGRKPRDVAESLIGALGLDEVVEPPEIAGPGFINFRVRPEHLSRRLREIQADPRLGFPAAHPPQRIAIDFSSPNLAKEMHIGTLRTTVIGDTLARLFEFLGHDVLRLNHVGDWGTQFGMLLQYVRETHPEVLERPDEFHVADLQEFYRAAKSRFDEDRAFADTSRRAVVELQSGDPAARRIWEAFCHESLRHAHEIYERLDVKLVDRGESFYNPMLADVVRDLAEKGMAVEDQGAMCVFLDGWVGREGEPVPLIIRKSGGGYMYATTDLAGVRHRIGEEKADRLIYVTDVRQAQHFQMVFQTARKAGWVPEHVSLEHVGYGMILGEDRRPFKTRSGETVRLKNVLDEAEERARAIVEAKNPELPAAEKAEIASAVGIGAVKYADLSHNPSSDYVFDWETTLAFDGNAAPYMLNTYVRVRSIGRKAGIDFEALPADVPILVEHDTEIALAKELLQFPWVIRQITEELKPNLLTDYLYGLSRAFSAFYDRERGVRVIDAPSEELRMSRLRLCDLTARVLKLGLGILGIRVLEQM